MFLRDLLRPPQALAALLERLPGFFLLRVATPRSRLTRWPRPGFAVCCLAGLWTGSALAVCFGNDLVAHGTSLEKVVEKLLLGHRLAWLPKLGIGHSSNAAMTSLFDPNLSLLGCDGLLWQTAHVRPLARMCSRYLSRSSGQTPGRGSGTRPPAICWKSPAQRPHDAPLRAALRPYRTKQPSRGCVQRGKARWSGQPGRRSSAPAEVTSNKVCPGVCP